MKSFIMFVICILGVQLIILAQNEDPTEKKDLRINLKSDGSKYVKFTITNQTWIRFNESNPGTMVNEVNKPQTFDIGLRRLRFNVIGQIHPKFLIYTQFGINNFTPLSPRKLGDFFHDALVEYTPVKSKLFQLSFGTGLTSWTGHSRFSAPAVASIMGYDAPIFQQTTNDATDQFLRKFTIYIKGKLWKLDYRFVLADPFTITSSGFFNPTISQYANFSPIGRSIQPSGYLSLQLFDQEDNQMPFFNGTYLGTKKVLSIGTGFQYQQDAMWYTRTGADTSFSDMFLLGADIFYDSYIGRKKDWVISVYAAYNYFNLGPGYLRMQGVMNPGQTIAAGTTSLNGTGNAYPMIGTGHSGYLQAGVMLPKRWFGNKTFTMMPYYNMQVAKWDRLNDVMYVIDAGINFLLDSYKYKMTINYQNRPVFDNTTLQQSERLSSVIFQFQIAI